MNVYTKVSLTSGHVKAALTKFIATANNSSAGQNDEIKYFYFMLFALLSSKNTYNSLDSFQILS